MIPGGPWGVWSSGLRLRSAEDAVLAAEQLEAAGYGALWMTGGVSNPFPRVRELLGATSRIVVATGILSIWSMRPADVIAELMAMPASYRDRFLLGLGVSHATLVNRRDPGRYRRPLGAMRDYLDELDASDADGVAGRRVLAALGPRMLELSATHAGGAHPYLTTPAHTQSAREMLGRGPFLAPTQMVVLEPDASIARAVARRHLALYLDQPNYVANWKRLGFTEDDTADGGSDRLIDAMVAWGDEDAVVRRLREHLDAGADHVCISVLDREAGWRDYPVPVQDWERLAPALTP